MNDPSVTTHTTVVESPAGVYVTAAEAPGLYRVLVCSNDPDVRELRARLKRYLDSDWQKRAASMVGN